ncbi:MAG: ArsR/SmtB family transcription factor [Microbacterium sp.]
MSEEMQRLREELDALTDRMDELEQARHVSKDLAPRESSLWALDGLQDRLDDDPSTVDGAVMLVGSLTLPTGASASWQQGIGTTGLLDAPWTEQASTLAALGHPVRIELLRHILSGVQTTSELTAIDSLSTTGQLHHHLRQLVAAGWVKQRGRGSYEIPAARIVPLLVCVLGAER